MSSNYIDLTTGKILPKMMMFVVPILLTNVIEMSFVAVDRMIVGHFVGVDALGGIGAVMPVVMFIVAISGGVFIGSMVLVSQSFGAKDYDRVAKITTTSYFLLILLSIISTLIGYVFANDILLLMNTPKEILQYSTPYMQIYFLGIFGMYGFFALRGMAQGVGDSKTPLYFLIFAVFLNIVLDILFVVYLDYGVNGAAYATIISQYTAFFLSALYYFKINHLVKISLKVSLFSVQILKEVLLIGIPAAIHFGAVMVFMMMIQVFVNGFGVRAVSAFSASSQIDAIVVVIFMSMSQALSSFIGQNKGSGNVDRMKQGLFESIILMAIVSLIMLLVIWLFGKDLLVLFSSEDFVVDIGYRHLIVVSFFYIFLATVFCLEGFFEGASLAHYSMTGAIVMMVSFAISGNILSQKYGLDGIWYGVGISQFIAMIMLIIFYIFGKHYHLEKKH